MAEVTKEVPHFGLGHFCGGCPDNNKLHTGCIVDGSVRVIKTPSQSTQQGSEQPVVVFIDTTEQADIRL